MFSRQGVQQKLQTLFFSGQFVTKFVNLEQLCYNVRNAIINQGTKENSLGNSKKHVNISVSVSHYKF